MKNSSGTLHLIPNSPRIAIPEFIHRLYSDDVGKKQKVLCYAGDLYLDDEVIPMIKPNKISEFIWDNEISRVVVHCLQKQVFPHLNVIQKYAPHCRLDWVYWGEMSGNPLTGMDDRTIVHRARHDSFCWLRAIAPFASGGLLRRIYAVRQLPFRLRFSNKARMFKTFYHFSEADFRNIQRVTWHSELKFLEFCYRDAPEKLVPDRKALLDLDLEPLNYVVVGHSGAYPNNHLDVLERIIPFALQYKVCVVVPLSYSLSGDHYMRAVDMLLREYPDLKYRIITDLYSKEQYSTLLTESAAFVAPARQSIGAGNLLEVVINGGVPVVDYGNPVADFLTAKGFEVSIYGGSVDIGTALVNAYQRRSEGNVRLGENMFSSDAVAATYRRMISGVIE